MQHDRVKKEEWPSRVWGNAPNEPTPSGVSTGTIRHRWSRPKPISSPGRSLCHRNRPSTCCFVVSTYSWAFAMEAHFHRMAAPGPTASCSSFLPSSWMWHSPEFRRSRRSLAPCHSYFHSAVLESLSRSDFSRPGCGRELRAWNPVAGMTTADRRNPNDPRPGKRHVRCCPCRYVTEPGRLPGCLSMSMRDAGRHPPLSNRPGWAVRCPGSFLDPAAAAFAGPAGAKVPRWRTPMFCSGFAIAMSTAVALAVVAVTASRAPIDSGWASG